MTEKKSMTMIGLTKGRIETLTDSVFAIAMTLMVFNMKVPEIPSNAVDWELSRKLFGMWHFFLVYAISFTVLGIYWIGHHNQFHWLRTTDRRSLWINLAFLFSVTLIPFSTILAGRYPEQRDAVIFYGANLILVGLLLFAHLSYAAGPGHLLEPNVHPGMIRFAKQLILSGPLACVVAIIVAFSHPRVAGVLYLLVPAFYVVLPGVDRRLSRYVGDAD
ncbi:MAG: TMEM175 family protein [Candidatus Acidiferrales bacterium]|jgi:uncharacterized membrane protein